MCGRQSWDQVKVTNVRFHYYLENLTNDLEEMTILLVKHDAEIAQLIVAVQQGFFQGPISTDALLVLLSTHAAENEHLNLVLRYLASNPPTYQLSFSPISLCSLSLFGSVVNVNNLLCIFI